MTFSRTALALAALLCFALAPRPLAQAQPAASQPASMPAAAELAAESHRLVNEPDEIVSVLEDGATVIVKRIPSPVLAVRAYIRTGGIYEGPWLGGGLSHLLEHLVAGGTNARRSEEENRNLLQQIGNDSNAYTTYDHTCYYVNTTADHLDQAVDLVTGWVLGAAITPAEYAREHQVVQRELEMNNGEPDSVFWRLAAANRYRVSPARVPVIGYQELIQGLSRDDVYNYYRLAYQPNNMALAVSGDLDPQRMLDSMRRYLAGASRGRIFDHNIPPEPPVLAPRTAVATFPGLGQAKLDLAFPSVRLDSPDLYALDVLATALGSGDSSILVEDLRDRDRLVSSITASNYTPSYVQGSFSVSMELDPARIAEATRAALAELDRARQGPLEESRLARAKAQLRAAHLKSMQKSADIIANLATDFLNTGDPHFGDRYVEQVQAVTAQQVQDAARKYLVRWRLLTTALLPAEYTGAAGLARAEDLLRPVAPTSRPTPPRQAGAVTRVELDNGITLLHKRIATTPLVEIRMYALGGLSAEDPRTNGLGNLTMEMVPRGTASRSATRIAEFFDSTGGDLNTACGSNTWYWNATCLKENFQKTMEVYADLVAHPAFAEQELAPMKQRIIADIRSQDADWMTQAMRFFKKSYYGPLGSPYQFMIIGTRNNVESFTTAQLANWYSRKVLSGRRVIAIYGDVDLDSARSAAQRLPGAGGNLADSVNSPATAPAQASASPGAPRIDVERIEVQKTEQPLAGIIIGFESNSVIGSPAEFPLTVADTITSGYGYPTGYLFDTLRGRGLVYVVDAGDMPGRSPDLPGCFHVYAGCEPQNVNEVIDLILQNMARCQGSPQDVQPDWFGRAKRLIATGFALQNETPAEQAQLAALDELYGLGYDYHRHFVDRIDAVTLDDVRELARRRLSRCVIAVSTPRPDLLRQKTGPRTYQQFPPVDLTPRGVGHEIGK